MAAIVRAAVTAAILALLPTAVFAESFIDPPPPGVSLVDPSIAYPEPVRAALLRMNELDKARGIEHVDPAPPSELAYGVTPASLEVAAASHDCGECVGCGDGCDCGEACCACPPTWTVYTGAVILNRAKPDPSRSIGGLNAQSIISSGSDFDFGWVGGPEISIARLMASGNAWEVRYFGALNWSSTINYGIPGNFQMGPFPNIGALNLSANYQTSLNSAEINWRHPMTERFTFLAGFRWIEMQDILHYRAAFAPLAADFYINDNNHLYGAQVGGEFNLWRNTSPWSLRSVGKAGIYGNSADNDFSLYTTPGGLIASDGRSRGQVAFVGEVGVNGGYQLNDHVTLRAGYMLLWLDGVAIASDQAAAALAALSTSVVDTRGDAFFHGATCGIEFAW